LLVKERWLIRWMIGTAMIPRGDVGLIFAELGRGFSRPYDRNTRIYGI
jgi:hypothetical protein